MKHASLFSGIGGFDLAADWMGWDNVLQCEYDEFCQTILNYYWPYAELKKDITATDFTSWNGYIDILTGGFPCQPYSAAGKRQGTEDDRHLWPEMLRAIREIEPTFVVGENVSGIVNWSGGMVFEEVQADLEAEGYEVQALLLPASGVNAPHRRDRTWFIAYAKCSGRGKWSGMQANKCSRNDTGQKSKVLQSNREGKGEMEWNATNTSNQRLQRSKEQRGIGKRKKKRNQQFAGLLQSDWQNFPTQPPVCGRDDGVPTELDGITFSKWRKESIKGAGNAVVPQLVYEIFKAIELTNKKRYCQI
jgi:DNA (cytosine-5)-methyltransferase 1